MNRKRRIIYTLIAILIMLAGVEGVLSFDPLGMIYLREVTALWSNSERIPAGWAQKPGTYQFRNWEATVIEGNTRNVPHTNTNAPNTWVILGDSVAFGYGVNDADTFANVMARALPDIHIINAATSGYSSENIRLRARDFTDANRLIYLIINNDAEQTPVYRPYETIIPTQQALRTPWTSLYVEGITYTMRVRANGSSVPSNVARFESDIRALAEDDRVMMVGFESDPLAQAARRWVGSEIIPDAGHPISWADGHPDAIGHQAIAAALLALIE